MVPGVEGCLTKLFHSYRWRWNVGITETQIDDVFTSTPGLELQPVDGGEDIWGK